MKKMVGMAGIVLALTGSVHAASMAVGDAIGVDFGPVADENNFNVLGKSMQKFKAGNRLKETNSSLINLNGAAMDGVSVTVTATSYFSNDASDHDVGTPPAGYSAENLTDWVGVVTGKGGTLTITFAGLNDSFAYDLNIGTAFKKNKNVNGTVYSAAGQRATNSNAALAPNFLDLKGLSTDGSGKLVITVSGSAAPSVSALTLTAAPASEKKAVKVAEPEAVVESAPAALGLVNANAERPNFVIILSDDQGYGDLGCYGSTDVKTPRIDKMAAEGARLTSFYVSAPYCTPSRASLMTGCYPQRIGMGGGVCLAADPKGLNPSEVTIAEVLKAAGYKTGMFGKWHLGDQREFLPTRQGFDEFFGLPYSHDIHPFNDKRKFPPLPLLEGETVVETDSDADYFTKRFTERSVKFIEEHKDEPFLLYLAHPAPHRPCHFTEPYMEGVSDEVRAALAQEKATGTINYALRDKLYFRAVNEIDWSVGQVLDALKEQGIDDNTIVIFFSDNGQARPPVGIGSPGPLQGSKGTTWEGGLRVPTVIRWPGHIAAGSDTDELLTNMDLMPTFAKLAGAQMPTDRVIDGKDIWPVLTQGAATPHEVFFYHRMHNMQAVRSGKWKLQVGGPAKHGGGKALFNLEDDIGETTNVAKQHPEVAQRLRAYVRAFMQDLKQNRRPAGIKKNAKPLRKTDG